MNQQNDTVVNEEMMKKLKDLGLSDGYSPVPDFLQGKAESLLKGKEVADIDVEMKQKLAELEAGVDNARR